jgi:hypothetical protein
VKALNKAVKSWSASKANLAYKTESSKTVSIIEEDMLRQATGNLFSQKEKG